MGATNSTRKLTIDSIALLEMLEPNAAEVQAKARVRERIQAILAKEWPTCRVLPFGSSESGLGFGGSDLDLGLYFDDVELEYQHHFTASERLQILSTVCTRLAGDFEIREFVQHARVPVVKLWDPHNQVACDVCVGSVHVLLNTALLKHCARSDPRVRPLAFAVKYWAKQRGINDSVNGTLSSYAFMLLLIFFLQSSRAQSLLPSVASVFHSIQTERTLSAVCHRLDSLSASAQSDSTFGSTEHESVGALLCGFFRFYACDFNMDDDVVSVRTGLPLAKASKWSRTPPWRISIEDPFEISHDVGRVVFNRIGQELLHKEFRRAYEMAMGGHRLEAICARDETMWSCHATCYVCSSTTHTPRECSQAIVRADGSTVAIGGRVNATRSMGDCWYCGGTGHVKATCPLYAYVAVPSPASIVPPAMAAVAPATAISSPIAISVKNVHANAVWPAAVLEHSPVRAGKKKKRPRRGSISSIASSPEQEHARKYMLAAGRQLSRKCGNTPRRQHGTATVPSVPCIT